MSTFFLEFTNWEDTLWCVRVYLSVAKRDIELFTLFVASEAAIWWHHGRPLETQITQQPGATDSHNYTVSIIRVRLSKRHILQYVEHSQLREEDGWKYKGNGTVLPSLSKLLWRFPLSKTQQLLCKWLTDEGRMWSWSCHSVVISHMNNGSNKNTSVYIGWIIHILIWYTLLMSTMPVNMNHLNQVEGQFEFMRWKNCFFFFSTVLQKRTCVI